MKNLSLLNFSLHKCLNTIPDALDKAKIKVAYLIFILNYPKQLIALWDDILYQREDAIKWNFVALILTTFILKVMLSRPQVIGKLIHLAIISSVISIFTVLIIDDYHLEILITQHIYMLIVFSFYGLGRNWGLIYSSLNVIIVVAYLIKQDTASIVFTNQQYNNATYIFIAIINFIVIILSHYYFHAALYGTIQEKKKLSEDLAKTAKDKTNFLSTMSHELRTPLNSVIGMSNILLRDAHNQRQLDNLKVLKLSAENLLSLINNILDFNKIEAENIELEKISFNVDTLFNNLKTVLKIKADEKNIAFYINIDETIIKQNILGDPTRLNQILINLLDNAIKFTNNGFVKLQASKLYQNKDNISIRFEIQDSGIGISANKRQLIFEPFKQAAQNTTRKYGGTGLGLAIAKHLIALSGSEITLSTKLGHGTTFKFDIVFPTTNLKIHTSQTPISEIIAENPKKWKILLAEDNDINIFIMKQLFDIWEIELTVVDNGQKAIDNLLTNEYDIILMDIHMPIMDGIEAAKRIRKLIDPQKANIKIIALTASVTEEVKKEIYEAKIDDYISKPFNHNELYRKMEQLIELST